MTTPTVLLHAADSWWFVPEAVPVTDTPAYTGTVIVSCIPGVKYGWSAADQHSRQFEVSEYLGIPPGSWYGWWCGSNSGELVPFDEAPRQVQERAEDRHDDRPDTTPEWLPSFEMREPLWGDLTETTR